MTASACSPRCPLSWTRKSRTRQLPDLRGQGRNRLRRLHRRAGHFLENGLEDPHGSMGNRDPRSETSSRTPRPFPATSRGHRSRVGRSCSKSSTPPIIGHGPSSKFTGSRGKYGANDAHPEYISAGCAACSLGRTSRGRWPNSARSITAGGGTVALYLAAYGMDTIDLGPCRPLHAQPLPGCFPRPTSTLPSSRLSGHFGSVRMQDFGKGNVLKKGEPTFPPPNLPARLAPTPPSKDFRLLSNPCSTFSSLCRSVWFNISNALT